MLTGDHLRLRCMCRWPCGDSCIPDGFFSEYDRGCGILDCPEMDEGVIIRVTCWWLLLIIITLLCEVREEKGYSGAYDLRIHYYYICVRRGIALVPPLMGVYLGCILCGLVAQIWEIMLKRDICWLNILALALYLLNKRETEWAWILKPLKWHGCFV